MTTIRQISGDGDLTDAFAVRHDVFIEEQGVDTGEEFDGKDESATHFVSYLENEPVGTLRVRFPDAAVAKVERVAVVKRYRRQGFGQQLMEAAEAHASEQPCQQVLLHAQTAVEAFYERLGYETVSDVFDEAGIPHVKMRKQLQSCGENC